MAQALTSSEGSIVTIEANFPASEDVPSRGAGQTNTALWNAVNGCSGCSTPGALDQWNNTTDANGNKTGYFLQNNQNLRPNDADIVIVLAAANALKPGTDAGSGNQTGPNGKPIPGKRVIALDPKVLNYRKIGGAHSA